MKKIKIKHIRKFEKLANQMSDLLKEIREYSPEANMYLEDAGNWNLLIGHSHNDKCQAMRQNIVITVRVPHSEGGGW